MSITQLLLDFLLNLLKDPKAAEEFKADPQGALDAAGLGGITEEDCDAVIPVVLDFAPVSAIGDRVYETGGNVLTGGDAHNNGGGGGQSGGGNGGGHAPVDTSPAVAQLTHVVNNYSYSEIDDRDTITDQSVNQNIWALGDVEQFFDNDAIVASGDGAAAAGDDAFVDNSDDHSTNIDVDGDVNIGNTEDSYNDDHSTDNSVDVEVDVEDSIIANDSFNEDDNSTNVDIDDSLLANDSFNEDNSINDSGNTDVDIDAEFEDSFNEDSSTTTNTTTNTATDSFNETDTDVDVDAEFENSFNQDTAIAQDSFNPEDSLNDNSTTVGDVDVEAEFTRNEDSVVFEENDVNVAVDDAAVID